MFNFKENKRGEEQSEGEEPRQVPYSKLYKKPEECDSEHRQRCMELIRQSAENKVVLLPATPEEMEQLCENHEDLPKETEEMNKPGIFDESEPSGPSPETKEKIRRMKERADLDY